MNVITFNRAYCLYPLATLEQGISLACTRRRSDLESVFNKYHERGWETIRKTKVVQELGLDQSFIMNIPRWLDDEDSWSIPLEYNFPQPISPVNPHSAALTRDPISATSWVLTRSRKRDVGHMRFDHVNSSQLFYDYIIECSEVINTPSMSALLRTASLSNTLPSGRVPPDDRR